MKVSELGGELAQHLPLATAFSSPLSVDHGCAAGASVASSRARASVFATADASTIQQIKMLADALVVIPIPSVGRRGRNSARFAAFFADVAGSTLGEAPHHLISELHGAAPLGLHHQRTPLLHHTSFNLGALAGAAGGGSGREADRIEPFCKPYQTAASRANIQDLTMQPVLTMVRARLNYQSPEVYSTDIADPKKWKKFFCGRMPLPPRPPPPPPSPPMANPEAAAGTKIPPLIPPYHPGIKFNGFGIKNVHVHLVDETTGKVHWDADFNIKPKLISLDIAKQKLMNYSELKNTASPVGGTQQEFIRPCTKKWDARKHKFDMSISTRFGTYEDGVTPWGNREGFGKFLGPNAHIGFDVYRLPKEDPFTGHQKLAPFTGKFGSGAVGNARFDDPHLRFVNDMYEPLATLKEQPYPKTGKVYYDWIDDPMAKIMSGGLGKFKYIDNLLPNTLTRVTPSWAKPGEEPAEWHVQFTGHADPPLGPFPPPPGLRSKPKSGFGRR